MPLFMDRHQVPGATAEDVAAAHVSDLDHAGKHGVRFFSYWFDTDDGEVFCFASAPTAEAMESVHAESHGIIPAEIIAVDQDDVVRFLGDVRDPTDATEVTSGFRIVAFTDIYRSTEMLDQLGQAEYMIRLTEHDLIVRKALAKTGGREVKHTGDGFLVSFSDVAAALRWASGLHETMARRDDLGIKLRIGMSAGEPVDHHSDIFGRAVTEASRITSTADPGSVLVSAQVRDLAVEAGFVFGPPKFAELKGFSDPVAVYQLAGAT